jgi:acetoin utilization protein AcuB
MTTHTKSLATLRIKDVMTPQPVTIGRGQPLSVAHSLMREHRCHHLPVLEHGELIGVVSQRDLYLLESIAGKPLGGDPVGDALTSETFAVDPDARVVDVAREMAREPYGCAVVLERDRVVGIFTATDALGILARAAS